MALYRTIGEARTRPYGGAAPSAGVTPEEERAFLEELAGQTWGGVEAAGKLLDTPAAILRGALADDPSSGFSWDSNRRVSGEDLLDYYGIQYDNPYVKTAAGFLAEMALDPLMLITGPMKALTPAGKAAKAAGLLDLAPVAAAKKLGGYSQAAKTITGRYTDDALRRTLPELQTASGPAAAAVPEALKARPLLGPRYSRSLATLDDVVQASDDVPDAMRRVQNFLDAQNLRYDDIKDQPLGGVLGFGVGEASAVWSPEAAKPVLDAMDALGQGIAWSAPVRYGSAWFDKRMRGEASAAGQIDMLRLAAREADEVDAHRRMLNKYLTPAVEASPSTVARFGSEGLMGEKGARFLRAGFENVPTASDRALLASSPELQSIVDDWDYLRKRMIGESRDLGLRRRQYGDKYGVLWSPRYAAEVDLLKPGRGAGGHIFSTVTNEGQARVWYLKTPGGTNELQDISVLPIVREHANLKQNSPYSNEQVGQAIEQYLERKYGQPVIGRKQSTLMANFMRNMKKDLPGDYPLFAEHPFNAQSRVLLNHARNRANVNFLYDKLTENAVRAYPSTIRGGGWKSLERAVQDVAEKTGLQMGKDGTFSKAVRKQIVDRIAQRFPHLSRKDIDLAKMAIPNSVYDRLTRMKSVFEAPQAWKDVWSMFEKATTFFKAFILAWPSRHVRDAYSNAFSVWLETGNSNDTVFGMNAASKFLAQDFDGAIPMLRSIPQYAKLATNDDVRRAFAEDAGASGILSTLASSDLLTARSQAAVTELVPGATPVRLSDAAKEFVPDGSRTPAQAVKDFFTIQNVTSDWNTLNPLLNASQKINDANDSIARLGGFIALLKQGVAPDVAAERITASLVDYSSLTDVEKNVFKVIFPWWAYSSRIGKYVVQSLMEHPGGRYGQTLRAMNTLQQSSEDQYIPTALRQQFAVRIPDALLPYIGRSAGDDVTTYLKNIDLPGIDPVFGTFVPGDYGLDVTETLQNLAQQAHPAIRTIGEMASGTDFFSKRPLKEAITPIDRIYQNLFQTKRRLSPTTKAILQNIPGTQRLVSLFGGLADQRLPFSERLVKQGINNTLGVQVYDVDEDYRDADLDRKITQELSPVMSSKPITFIPQELVPELTPRQQKLYAVKKSINKRQSKRLEEKRKKKEFSK